MYLLLGNLRMESSDYEGAIKSFELARAQLRPFPSQSLFVVALVNFLTSVLRHNAYSSRQVLGWKFDNLDILVRQGLSEALYLAGRRMDAGKSLLKLINAFGKEVYMHGDIVEWVSGEPTLCPSMYSTF